MFENTVAVAGGVGRIDAAAAEAAPEVVDVDPEEPVADEAGSLGLPDVAACVAVARLLCAL
jgi:hypothetical protein